VRTRARVCAAAFSLALLASPACAQFKTPEAAVQALYDFYTGANSKGLPSDAKTRRRFFEPELLRLFVSAKNIDSDFFVQGQDWELSELKIERAAEQDNKATVGVAFKTMDDDVRLTYELVKAKDGWRIADVKTVRNRTLRNALQKARAR
jgi:opacity protein-like surface antigen